MDKTAPIGVGFKMGFWFVPSPTENKCLALVQSEPQFLFCGAGLVVKRIGLEDGIVLPFSSLSLTNSPLWVNHGQVGRLFGLSPSLWRDSCWSGPVGQPGHGSPSAGLALPPVSQLVALYHPFSLTHLTRPAPP